MVMSDLLNDFWRESENEAHLKCFTNLIRQARPYTLDDDAVDLITEISSGKTISEKLSIYRKLARIPFETIWIELNYAVRHSTQKRLGTNVSELSVDSPIKMGWLIRRIDDTTWRATTVAQFSTSNSGRKVDVFGCDQILSTEGIINYTSTARDPMVRKAVNELNTHIPAKIIDDGDGNIDISSSQAFMWGFGSKKVSIPRHLARINALELSPSFENIIKTISKTEKEKFDNTIKQMKNSCSELRGDLRFLCAALALINEVPMTYRNHQQPGVARVGGRLRPYMINRVVSITIPKTRGRTTKIMSMLRLAERAIRRHEVCGHWRNINQTDGTIKKIWIKEHMRGDASLGFVKQERIVEKS